jgi:hypothetical protein
MLGLGQNIIKPVPAQALAQARPAQHSSPMVTTAIYLALLAMRQVTLRSLWGRTYYFHPPLCACCPDLVTESALELTYKNFTPVVPLTMHKSGSL